MNSVFIGGIPTVGKSYLAKKVSEITKAEVVRVDDLREEMTKDSSLKPWVNFFWNKDESKYWKETSCKEHWENIKKQSEAFWPTILQTVKKKSNKAAIYEGVNILPHLAHKDLSFSGIFLLTDSVETILERIKKDPRWSSNLDLQQREAEEFFHCEQPKYKAEAEKYGFKTFTNINEAETELLRLIHA